MENSENASFCTKCGSSLSNNASFNQAINSNMNSFMDNNSNYANPVNVKAASSGGIISKILIIIVGFFVLFAFLGFLVMLF